MTEIDWNSTPVFIAALVAVVVVSIPSGMGLFYVIWVAVNRLFEWKQKRKDKMNN